MPWFPFSLGRPATLAVAGAILCALPMCKKSEPEHKDDTEKSAEKDNPSSSDDPADALASRAHQDKAIPQPPALKRIESFTGARTKIVWNECQNPRRADPFSFTDDQLLMGLDTADPRGERPLLEQKDNYSRPLISPDGEKIVYTTKSYGKKVGTIWTVTLEIYQTDWKGTPPVKIGDGYAMALWREPATGRTWVYTGADVPPQEERTFNFKKLVRFPLDAPPKIEVLWEESLLSPDNIQLSRDGQSLCALLPWPSAGLLRFENGALVAHKFTTGCWPSHAPDNSNIFWVFDGGHRSATFFAQDGTVTWDVPFNDAPQMQHSEVYHPRWTNHPRFLVLTGPYISTTGAPIGKTGVGAQVNLGRFSPKLDQIEECLQITHNTLSEGFPDAWIQGGDQVNLTGFDKLPKNNVPPVQASTSTTWPSKPEGLVFLWSDRPSLNRFTTRDGKQHQARIELQRAARSGRFNEISLDGGVLKLSRDSAALVTSAWKPGADASFEALMIPPENPEPAGQARALLTAPGLALSIKDQRLSVTADKGTWQCTTPLPDQPFHLAVSRTAAGAQAWINGKPTELTAQTTPANAPADSITFGGGWGGGIMRIALFDRALTTEETAADAAQILDFASKFTPAPARVKLTGKLVKVSPVPSLESIEPYTSSLVACVYEVQGVLSGEYKDKRILVKHWGLLNREATTTFPREVGKTYELVVEPEAGHPNLKGERISDETDVFDLEPWLDVATPAFQN